MIKKSVNQVDNGVKITFSGAVAKQNIISMIENCSTGKCECMSEQTKKKIQNMQVAGEDGNVALSLEGDISVSEIESALKKSKVLNKNVLVMCTGNSCRSIIAEALINAKLDGVRAQSCGVAPSGKVNENAKKVLMEHGVWDERYYSKHLDAVIEEGFDLVVTVCDHAKESCPIFPKEIQKVHIGFEDPDGKEYTAFEKTFAEIESQLLPKVAKILMQEESRER